MTDPQQILRNASVLGMRGQELVPMEAALEALRLAAPPSDPAAPLREALEKANREVAAADAAHAGEPMPRAPHEGDYARGQRDALRWVLETTPSDPAAPLREAILARPEWIGWDTIYCYWCDNSEHEGHAPNCLRAALATDGHG